MRRLLRVSTELENTKREQEEAQGFFLVIFQGCAGVGTDRTEYELKTWNQGSSGHGIISKA